MHIHISEKYLELKDDINNIISNFNSYENSFDTGRRNSLKKVKIKDKTYVIKSFKKPHLLNQFIYKYFRKSKAERSYKYANRLLDLGINTPKAVCYIENHNIWGIQDSYSINEFIDYDLTFWPIVMDTNLKDRDLIIKKFTEFTYNLHEKGIEFLDHSPGNTLIVKKDNGYKLYLVDLNRINFKKPNLKKRLKNFTKLTDSEELIRKISSNYAPLVKMDFEYIFKRMWHYNQLSSKKRQRKEKLKKLLKR